MLIVGLYPFDFRKNRQGDIHGLDREIDPHHFFRLQGGIGLDAHSQGADIQDLADFIDRGVFPGKKPIALDSDNLLEGLPGRQALFVIRVHDKFPPWISHRKGTKGAKKNTKINVRARWDSAFGRDKRNPYRSEEGMKGNIHEGR
jgi:hypothetical protein